MAVLVLPEVLETDALSANLASKPGAFDAALTQHGEQGRQRRFTRLAYPFRHLVHGSQLQYFTATFCCSIIIIAYTFAVV